MAAFQKVCTLERSLPFVVVVVCCCFPFDLNTGGALSASFYVLYTTVPCCSDKRTCTIIQTLAAPVNTSSAVLCALLVELVFQKASLRFESEKSAFDGAVSFDVFSSTCILQPIKSVKAREFRPANLNLQPKHTTTTNNSHSPIVSATMASPASVATAQAPSPQFTMAQSSYLSDPAALHVKTLSEHAILPKRGSDQAAGYDLSRCIIKWSGARPS